MKTEAQQITFKAAATVCGTSSIGRFYLRSRSGTLLPCLPSPSCFRQPRFPYDRYPPPTIPLDATRNGSAAHPIQFRHIVRTRGTENEANKYLVLNLYVAKY